MIEPTASEQNPPLADFSLKRRAHAVRLLRDEKVLERTDLDDAAKLIFTVGLLVCDWTGFVPKDGLARGLADLSIVNVARQIMAEAIL
jgi:hypothetical protein